MEFLPGLFPLKRIDHGSGSVRKCSFQMDGIVLENVSGYTVNSNAVFNWNVCPKMKNGITEDAKSYNNNISNNTVNFYSDSAVVSQGTGTVVTGNVGRGDVPYTSIKWKESKAGEHEFNSKIIQTFQPELTEEYMRRNY